MGTQLYNSSTVTPIRVTRANANLPQGVAAAIFTVSGGKVLISDIIGEVETTAIAAGSNNMKLISNPTTGADVDLCATVDIDGDAIGTMYHITGTLADAMVATTSGSFLSQASVVTVAPGTIDLSCSASKTGKIKWTLVYIALDEGAKVIAA
jgi:hypothetical protein